MIRTIVLLVCMCLFGGVKTDEVKSVSVMEGDSVTLNPDLQIQRDEETVWKFNSVRMAKVTEDHPTYEDERFRDRLKLDQTGSLTITNTRTTDSGLYQLDTVIENKESMKKFNVTVYASLSVPVITSYISKCSSSSENPSNPKCVLQCSVFGVRHVTLSWYKGNSSLSNINMSDLSISLSLPLEVEYQDNNTYSCVVSNPISHQTKHICIADLCRVCSDEFVCGSTETVIRLVVTALVGLAAVAAFIVLVYDIKSRRVEHRL